MKSTMRAMVLEAPGSPLVLRERPVPTAGATEVLVRVEACGVCRTDLHVVDGDLPFPGRQVIPGHEIVGRVVSFGSEVHEIAPGQRVGIPWLGWTCGSCRYCRSGAENLCDRAEFTGYTRQGGYADLVLADARYVFPLPDNGDAAPWRHSSVRASSGIARIASRETAETLACTDSERRRTSLPRSRSLKADRSSR